MKNKAAVLFALLAFPVMAFAVDTSTETAKAVEILRDSKNPYSRLDRAIVHSSIDSDNAIRAKFSELLDAIALATSLANLKTRAADIGALPPITPEQARGSIKSNLEEGFGN
jgi:hypothetical protein